MIKTIVVIIPNLYKLLSFKFFSTVSSTIVDIITPNSIKIAQIIKAGNGLNISPNMFDDSGIKEINDIVNIIPLEKARAAAIKEFWFFFLKKHGIIPIMVEKPAIVVVKKLIIVFIVNYMNSLNN